jgi:uncharacterized protein (TIGR02145 family)
VWKRMPTDEEFDKLGKEDFWDVVYAGFSSTNGSFGNLGAHANFWSSSESGTSAWYSYLHSSHSTVRRTTNAKAYGVSVRCVKE